MAGHPVDAGGAHALLGGGGGKAARGRVGHHRGWRPVEVELAAEIVEATPTSVSRSSRARAPNATLPGRSAHSRVRGWSGIASSAAGEADGPPFDGGRSIRLVDATAAGAAHVARSRAAGGRVIHADVIYNCAGATPNTAMLREVWAAPGRPWAPRGERPPAGRRLPTSLGWAMPSSTRPVPSSSSATPPAQCARRRRERHPPRPRRIRRGARSLSGGRARLRGLAAGVLRLAR